MDDSHRFTVEKLRNTIPETAWLPRWARGIEGAAADGERESADGHRAEHGRDVQVVEPGELVDDERAVPFEGSAREGPRSYPRPARARSRARRAYA